MFDVKHVINKDHNKSLTLSIMWYADKTRQIKSTKVIIKVPQP